MNDRVWIEMPVVGTGAVDDPVRSKYPVRGKAFLMHREGKVYVLFGDELAREEAARHADCRRLTPSEGRAFEESLPFPVPPQLFCDHDSHNSRLVRLGDLIAWLTRRVGITECSGCKERKRWLNGIVVSGWGRR